MIDGIVIIDVKYSIIQGAMKRINCPSQNQYTLVQAYHLPYINLPQRGREF